MTKTKKLVLYAMLSALAYVAMLVIHIPVSFLTIDPKDTVIVIAGFIMGPLASLIISVVVSLVEMITVSNTGVIGFVMNTLSSAAFCCTAALIYKKRHSIKGAVVALAAAVLAQTVVMLLWDWLMVPLYMEHATREMVVGMLMPLFLPFNLLKGGINMALALLLYKPMTSALRRAGLVPRSEHKGKINIYLVIFAVVLLAVCVILALILAGIL
ncbi:MAG: ECF transporter S component [Oscillospiraceae bacterium]|nr:ECF transporter S component [Oscillospiraceae bacterium]